MILLHHDTYELFSVIGKKMDDIKKLNTISLFRGLTLYAPVLALYFAQFGITVDKIVYVSMFYSMGMLLTEIPTGILADKYGQKFSLILSAITGNMGVILMFLFPSFLNLTIGYVLRGVGRSLLSGSDEALLFRAVEQKHGNSSQYQKYFSEMRSFYRVGIMLSGLIAGLAMHFLESDAYNFLFISTIVLLGISAYIPYTLKADIKHFDVGLKGSHMLEYLRAGIKTINSNQALLFITLAAGFLMSGQYIILPTFQPYLEDHGTPGFWIGAVISIGAFLNFLLLRYSGKIRLKLSVSQVYILTFGTLIIAYALIGVLDNWILLILAYILALAIYGFERPSVSEIINKNTHDEIRSTVISTVSFSREVLQSIMRLGAGYLMGIVSYGVFWQAYSIYLLIALISFIFGVRKFLK